MHTILLNNNQVRIRVTRDRRLPVFFIDYMDVKILRRGVVRNDLHRLQLDLLQIQYIVVKDRPTKATVNVPKPSKLLWLPMKIMMAKRGLS